MQTVVFGLNEGDGEPLTWRARGVVSCYSVWYSTAIPTRWLFHRFQLVKYHPVAGANVEGLIKLFPIRSLLLIPRWTKESRSSGYFLTLSAKIILRTFDF